MKEEQNGCSSSSAYGLPPLAVIPVCQPGPCKHKQPMSGNWDFEVRCKTMDVWTAALSYHEAISLLLLKLINMNGLSADGSIAFMNENLTLRS